MTSNETSRTAAGAAPDESADPACPDTLNAEEILTAVGEAVYEWTIADDRVRWSANAAEVLPVKNAAALHEGRRFAALIDPDSPLTRFDAVAGSGKRDHGDGQPYCARYCLKGTATATGEAIWIEDTGVWFGDGEGLPARARGIVRKVTERHAAEVELSFLSQHDALTGQLNRAHLMKRLAEAIATAREKFASCAFLIAGIDNLAVVNDTYGYEVADRVIATVATRLQRQLRSGDSLGRLSGNKFGIVLNACSEAEMEVAAERLLDAIASEVVTTELGPVSVTISIGGVSSPRHATSATKALGMAHEALDHVHRRQSNGFAIYQPSESRAAARRRNVEMADAIVKGLNERRFRLAYQPIVEAATGKPVYHECLLRLDTAGPVEQSGALIAAAERLGLVRLIDHRVLELAVETLARYPAARLSINISAECIGDRSWMQKLVATLARRPQFGRRLAVELTETAVVRNVGEAARFIAALRDLSVKTAIDDFGTGYSSFHILKELSADLVKIDGSFITTLLTDERHEVFVTALVEIAKTFHLETVAEWVRDEETAARLRALGVDFFQGELYGLAASEAPWPEDERLKVPIGNASAAQR
ncbi:diguanylate cyclase (GGDEF)-like protein [Rhodobium orientis]|nr:GGDEF and EAL domain-containing protein [Rhodobium orientis]MBB4303687.1 diguanylate cyclase (GGDEF)-like protein [Rhodobium orientis]